MRQKKVWLVLTTFLVIVIAGSIYSMKEKNEEKQIILEAQKATEHLIISKYKNIESVTFEESEFLPMNGVSIEGYINNNKEKTFSVIYDYSLKEVGSYIVDAEEKEECLKTSCE